MFSCREATRLASTALDRRLSLGEWMQLFMHLLMCTPCKLARRRMFFLRDAARRLHETETADSPTAPRLSPEGRARIKRALDDGSV